MSRECSTNGQWSSVDFSSCTLSSANEPPFILIWLLLSTVMPVTQSSAAFASEVSYMNVGIAHVIMYSSFYINEQACYVKYKCLFEAGSHMQSIYSHFLCIKTETITDISSPVSHHMKSAVVSVLAMHC